MKIKLPKIKPRNYLAVHAHNKTSAGPMKDHKKEKNKNLCRENDLDLEEDLEYNDFIDENSGDQ